MPLYFPGTWTHPFPSSISVLSGPSSTSSVSFPPAYIRSVVFLSTWLPPLQPSPSSLAAFHLPLSPCRFSYYALLFPLLPVPSPPLTPLSEPSSGDRINLQHLFRSAAPWSFPPISSTLPYFLWWAPVVILDHRTSRHVPSIISSIPCHIEYLFLAPSLSSVRYCLMETVFNNHAERAGYLERMNEWMKIAYRSRYMRIERRKWRGWPVLWWIDWIERATKNKIGVNGY